MIVFMKLRWLMLFLPEVLAVQYEENSILFSRLRTIFSHALESLPLTPNRSLMYKQDVIREREKAQYKTVEAYLESLEMFFPSNLLNLRVFL